MRGQGLTAQEQKTAIPIRHTSSHLPRVLAGQKWGAAEYFRDASNNQGLGAGEMVHSVRAITAQARGHEIKPPMATEKPGVGTHAWK